MKKSAMKESDRLFVNRIRLAHIATITPSGTPHVSPKGTFWATRDGRAGFIHIRSGRTLRNIRANPHVSVSVTDIFQRRGLIITGTARTVEQDVDPVEYADLASSFVRARGPVPATARAIVIVEEAHVERVTLPAYDNGATVEEVEVVWRRHYESDNGQRLLPAT